MKSSSLLSVCCCSMVTQLCEWRSGTLRCLKLKLGTSSQWPTVILFISDCKLSD